MKKKTVIVAAAVLCIAAALWIIYVCSFDKSSLESIKGSYSACGNKEVHNDVVLDISDTYISIYDAGAGNPGISGKLVKVSEDSVTILVKYYEDSLAERWERKGPFMTIGFEKTKRGIALYNNDYPVTFKSDDIDDVFCYLWRSESKRSVEKFVIYDEGGYEYFDWYYDVDRGWIQEGCPCSVIMEDACRFFDDVESHSEVTCSEFRKLLKGNLENIVIQATCPQNLGVTELRLLEIDESPLADVDFLHK